MWCSLLSSFSVGHLLLVVQKTVLNFLAISSATPFLKKVFMMLSYEVIQTQNQYSLFLPYSEWLRWRRRYSGYIFTPIAPD